jgi:hypothetical protein
MKELGPIHHYLNYRIVRDRPNRLIYMVQDTYARTVLERFNMADCNSRSTPMEPGLKLGPLKPGEEGADVPYAALCGSLNYFAQGTRPDMAFAHAALSRHMAEGHHGKAHWEAGKHCLKYLQGSADLALQLGGDEPVLLQGWTDASWGDVEFLDEQDRLRGSKSSLGWMFTLGAAGGPVEWGAKHTGVTDLSTCEAEYYALEEAIKRTLWLRELLAELGCPQEKPTVIHCDNNSAIKIMKEPGVQPGRTRHMQRAVDLLLDHEIGGAVVLKQVNTEDNPADIFTKALPAPRHGKLLELMRMRRLPAACGAATVLGPGGSVARQKTRESGPAHDKVKKTVRWAKQLVQGVFNGFKSSVGQSADAE